MHYPSLHRRKRGGSLHEFRACACRRDLCRGDSAPLTRRKRPARAASAVWPTSRASSSWRLRTSRTHGRAIGINYPVTSGDNLWVGNDGRAEVDFGGGAVPPGRRHQSSRVAPRRPSVRAVRRAGPREPARARPRSAARARASTRRMRRSRSRGPGLYRVDVSDDREHTHVVVREGEVNVLDRKRRAAGAAGAIRPTSTAPIRATRPCRTASASTASTRGSPTAIATTASRTGELRVAADGRRGRPRPVRHVDAERRTTARCGIRTTLPTDWAPYRNGYWVDVGAWGPTWVDYAPWGYAPFHYGRWAYVGGRWGWCSGQLRRASALGAGARRVDRRRRLGRLDERRRAGLRLGAARVGRAVPSVVGPLLVRLLGSLQPAVRGQRDRVAPEQPGADARTGTGMRRAASPPCRARRSRRASRCSRTSCACRARRSRARRCWPAAPIMRSDPARVAQRPVSAPPPASTFQPTIARTAPAPVGNSMQRGTVPSTDPFARSRTPTPSATTPPSRQAPSAMPAPQPQPSYATPSVRQPTQQPQAQPMPMPQAQPTQQSNAQRSRGQPMPQQVQPTPTPQSQPTSRMQPQPVPQPGGQPVVRMQPQPVPQPAPQPAVRMQPQPVPQPAPQPAVRTQPAAPQAMPQPPQPQARQAQDGGSSRARGADNPAPDNQGQGGGGGGDFQRRSR